MFIFIGRWRFENGDGGPKLEDFLGGGINVNVSLNSDDIVASGDCYFSPPPCPLYYTTNQNSHQNCLIPETTNGVVSSPFKSWLQTNDDQHINDNGNGDYEKSCRKRSLETKSVAASRKSMDSFGQRTSRYRGVTRHRWTGRYEAHLWDNTCRKEGQTRKGRQGRILFALFYAPN